MRIKSNKINGPIRITQITDYHSNQNINLDELFQKISDFNPNIIVLTGDIIDYKTRDFNLASKVLKISKEITSHVYVVNGNHELINKNYRDFQYLLEQNGAIILDDTSMAININKDRIKLFGASFYADENDYKNLFSDIKPEEYNILLSHSPNKPLKFLDDDTDLILSGHTHGGQVRLPLIGSLIAPGQGTFPKYDKGIYHLGNTVLYIDSGLGNSVYPIRMFNRVQISNLIIEPK